VTRVHAVEVQDAARQYAPGHGVCGVSLGLPAGSCLAILGRNGSGKSTLTRLVLGLEPVERGRVAVFGAPPPRAGSRGWARLGVALDGAPHWEALSGWRNALFALRSYGLGAGAAEDRLGGWFERAGLAAQAHDPVRTYSFGMRRKLALVQALAHDPELLVLDEPTAGVDAHFEAALSEEVRRRTRDGRSTWVAGNDPEWVSTLGGKVAFLEAGRVIAAGSVEKLVAETSPWRQVKVSLARPLRAAPPLVPGVRSLTAEGCAVDALVGADPLLLPALLARLAEQGGEITSVEVRGATLRDALLLRTGTSP